MLVVEEGLIDRESWYFAKHNHSVICMGFGLTAYSTRLKYQGFDGVGEEIKSRVKGLASPICHQLARRGNK